MHFVSVNPPLVVLYWTGSPERWKWRDKCDLVDGVVVVVVVVFLVLRRVNLFIELECR